MDDAALLARIADRDEQAIELLHARFGSAMHAVALRVTHQERLAEEVVQDALMAVWRDPSKYDPSRGALGPWLLTMTRYKAIDVVRRESIVQKRTADVDLELREAPDDVHDEVWLGIRRERLYEAIRLLGDDQRRALELAFLGGLTHVEVAEQEGIPLGTAKTRIRSALLKLREHLGPTLGAEAPAPAEPVRTGARPLRSPVVARPAAAVARPRPAPGVAPAPVPTPNPIPARERTGDRS